MDALARHIDDGTCWCDQWGPNARQRTEALDRIYPDRCHLVGDEATPNHGLSWCVYPDGHTTPCRSGLERPGDPCHFCDIQTDPNGAFCRHCFTSLDGMALADIKAHFAAGDSALSIDPVVT